MLHTGLLSITFRQLKAEDIIFLAKSAQLESVEWGGDVHVPHGDTRQAQNVGQMTLEAGLSVSAYGSYYRLATADSPSFDSVLDTAEALGAPIIRVWAGTKASAEAETDYRDAVIEDAVRIVEMAAKRSVIVSLEYHNHTLTDSLESTLQLLNRVDHPNLRTFWQPPHTSDLEMKKQGLRTLLPWLTNVHVFQWHPQTKERYPLVDGSSDWKTYIDLLRSSSLDHTLSLEFVRDDSTAAFIEDAHTLHEWLES